MMEQSTLISRAIQNLRPQSEFSFNDEDISSIEWVKLDGKAPTEAEINAEIEKVKASDLAKEAERLAKKAELLAKLGITEDEARLLLS